MSENGLYELASTFCNVGPGLQSSPVPVITRWQLGLERHYTTAKTFLLFLPLWTRDRWRSVSQPRKRRSYQCGWFGTDLVRINHYNHNQYRTPASSVARGGAGRARAPPIGLWSMQKRMYFVLLRPIFCEKWKIAPPIRKEPPLRRLNLRNLGEKSLWILTKTFFFFFFLEIT